MSDIHKKDRPFSLSFSRFFLFVTFSFFFYFLSFALSIALSRLPIVCYPRLFPFY